MAEADCKEEKPNEGSSSALICPAKSVEEIISPLEEIAYVKSHRMRRVRWSEDLEEIRYFSVKTKKHKEQDTGVCSTSGLPNDAQIHSRRRLSDLPISSVEKFKAWLDDKDFKSDVVLLGLKMKSAFKKADFYNTERDWDKVFDSDAKNVALNGIEYTER
jgi:hypothetical protein